MNAAELLNACDQVKTWAQRNKAIIALAEALEKIGCVEQAAAEANRRHTTALAGAQAAQNRLDALIAQERAAEVRAADTEKQAKACAAEIVSAAEVNARAVVEKANADAADVLAKARDEAERIVSEAQKRKADLGALASRHENEAKAAQEKLSTANAQLSDVQGRIDHAKGEIKRLLG